MLVIPLCSTSFLPSQSVWKMHRRSNAINHAGETTH
jgi:hypothetical protein